MEFQIYLILSSYYLDSTVLFPFLSYFCMKHTNLTLPDTTASETSLLIHGKILRKWKKNNFSPFEINIPLFHMNKNSLQFNSRHHIMHMPNIKAVWHGILINYQHKILISVTKKINTQSERSTEGYAKIGIAVLLVTR